MISKKESSSFVNYRGEISERENKSKQTIYMYMYINAKKDREKKDREIRPTQRHEERKENRKRLFISRRKRRSMIEIYIIL